MRILLLFTFITLLFSNTVSAQINAITDSGEQVYLFDDGTWKYVDAELNKLTEKEIPVNEQPFSKSEDQSFLLKSTRMNLGIWLNPKKWAFTKGSPNDDMEYEFELRNEDLYGMVITEKLQIPIESLKRVAYENAVSAAPDLTIVQEEYRTVNELELLMMKMEGTIDGIKFAYNGYYYSNESGTVQVVLYTGSNLMKEYQEEAEAFLNGITELE